MGGVNHCSLHCRLAKLRGLMIVVKHGAVIGYQKFIAWKLWLGTYKSLSANHSAVFDHDHQNHGISPNDSVNYSQVRIFTFLRERFYLGLKPVS